MPTNPASAPEIRKTLIWTAPIEIPPARADPGDEPTARASYPRRIRLRKNQTSTEHAIPIGSSRLSGTSVPTPKRCPRLGAIALFGKRSDRRLMLNSPALSVNLSGPRSAQATRLIATPFNMIVVTTSCAPVFTLSTAGMAAYAIPPIIAKINTTGNWSTPRNPKCAAAIVATPIATRY